MEYIDTSYDHLFAERGSLPWWPWVGRDFATSEKRTMVVGESIYKWPDKADAFERRYAKTTGLRDTHHGHAMDVKRPARFVRNVERAIFYRSKPHDAQKVGFWTSVVYHNLVLRPLDSLKRGDRPKQQDFRNGWEEVLDLCDILSVQQVLVYGVSSAGALKDVCKSRGFPCSIKATGPAISRCRARIGVVESGRSQIQFVFILHPSKPFSWKKWSPVIRSNLMLPEFVQKAEEMKKGLA